MIINFRYHIASLVAVFLALAIGILIGTTLLGNDTLTKTQQTIINDLKKNYDKIVSENKDSQFEIKKLQDAIGNEQEYESKTLPLLINNALQGKQIAIIESISTDSKNNLVNALKLSGATVVSDTVIKDGLNIDDQNKRAKIAQELNLQGENQDGLAKDISHLIAEAILTGQNNNVLDFLNKNDLIKTNGSYGIPVNAIVIIGGSSDEKTNKAEIVDTPIINYFTEQKIPVYGVEQSNAASSYIKTYQKSKITTIDDIDLVPGQAALVWAIEKQIPGDFGIKSTAKQLLPNM